ncbi:MAG: hypothetical protein ACYCWE_16045 [Eubacteriales bacterium]
MTTRQTKFKGLIVLVILFGMAASGCSDNIAETNEQLSEPDTAAASETDDRIAYDLPVNDYGGYDFVFLVREFDGNGYWGSQEVFAEEQNAVPVNDAVFNRNLVIFEKYNVKISEVRSTDPYGNINKTVSAADHAYDCVMPNTINAASLTLKNALVPFDSLPHIDLSQSWWEQSSNEQLTIANRLYFAMGDLNILDNEATYVMMFNKDVSNSHNITDLYDSVRNNVWTYDKLGETIALVSADLDGNGKYDINDRFGLLTDTLAIKNGLFYASGISFFSKDENDLPVLTGDVERAVSVLEKLLSITSEKANTMLASDLKGISDPWTNGLNKMFKEGNGLFYAIGLTVINKMRDMDSDFGIVPYPKYDENQENYISYVAAHCTNCVAVPVTCTDFDMTSLILESMSYESKYTVMPAYYDVTITNKTMRDAESAEMLDIIFAHRGWDMAEIYNWGSISDLVTTLTDAGKFASSYEKKLNATVTGMNKTIEAYLSQVE